MTVNIELLDKEEERILQECKKKDIDVLLADLAKAYEKYEKSSEFYKVGKKIHKEAKLLVYSYWTPYSLYQTSIYLSMELSYPYNCLPYKVHETKKIKEPDETKLKVSIFLATEVLNRPDDFKAIRRLEENANENRPPHWKRFLAKLAMLAGFATVCLSAVIACLPDFTGGIVTFGTIACSVLGSFIGLVGSAFNNQYEKQAVIPDKLSKLAKVATKQRLFKSSENSVEKPTEESIRSNPMLVPA